MKISFQVIVSFALLLVLISCGGGRRPTPVIPPGTQVRAIEALPPQIDADIITVGQFRSVCDRLARSMMVQHFVIRAPSPPIITIRKLQNKTGIPIDESIFQETIRARLMEHAGGAVLFRDDVSYRDIVQERLRQSNNEVTVSITDSVVSTRSRDRIKEKQFDQGFLSGTGGTDEKAYNVEDQSEMEMAQSGSVKSKVAAADYFLRGLIYQIKERDSNNRNRGMNYFQYQFRLVDARNGIIVWEKMLDSKLEGTYAPLQATQGGQVGAAGQFPAPGIQQPGAQPGQPGNQAWPPTQGGQQQGGQQAWPPTQGGQQQGGQQAWPPAGQQGQAPSAFQQQPLQAPANPQNDSSGVGKSLIKNIGKIGEIGKTLKKLIP